MKKNLKKVGSMDNPLVGMDRETSRIHPVIQRFSEKLHKIPREISVLESLFNEFSGLETYSFAKK